MELRDLIIDCYKKRDSLKNELKIMDKIIKILDERFYKQQISSKEEYKKNLIELQKIQVKLDERKKTRASRLRKL